MFRENKSGSFWLEIFYDLIYAVAVIELSSILESDLSLRGFLGLCRDRCWRVFHRC